MEKIENWRNEFKKTISTLNGSNQIALKYNIRIIENYNMCV